MNPLVAEKELSHSKQRGNKKCANYVGWSFKSTHHSKNLALK